MKGSAIITRDNKIFAAKKDDPIFQSDIIETLKNSRMKLHFADNSIITLHDNSRLVIKQYSGSEGSKKDISVLELLIGEIKAVSGRSSLEVDTPTAVAAARGTEFYVWEFDNETGVAVLVGEVEFWIIDHPEWREIIENGYMAFSRNNEQPESPSLISPELISELEMLEQDLNNNDVIQCGICNILNDENTCVPDNTIDPGPCQKCSNGVSVPDNTEDPGMCLRCNKGEVKPDNTEDPGMCLRCNSGEVKPDNTEDPGMCLRCNSGEVKPDNTEDPGMCQKCNSGEVKPDNTEDPGMCRKCSGGNSVPDDQEYPGECLKCSAGNPVPDNLQDPGICYKCSGGSSVPDDFEYCSDGNICSINDRCQGGICRGDIDPSPIDPNCI